MSGTREEMLEEIVRSGDVERCLAFFEGMPEKERKKLAREAIRLNNDYHEFENGRRRWDDNDKTGTCISVALYATATFGQIKRLGWRGLPSFLREDWQEPLLAALRDRQPEWLPSLCKTLVESEFQFWDFARMIVREGLCEPPESEMYVLGMIYGVRDKANDHHALDGLRKDPELLDDMVWRLFEIQGNRSASLTYRGDITGEEKGWSHALRELSKEGALDRQRLLDESLAALNRDFTQYYASWFSRFHEYMEPTIEERTGRVDRYLDLLGSPIQPTVTMAVKALQTLHKAGRLDGGAFAARAEPALYAKAKAAVKQALTMLGSIAGKEPALAPGIALLATAALEHKAAEAQQAALTLIEKHGDPRDAALREAMEDRLAVMAPTARKNAETWLGAEETASPDIGENDPDDIAALVERAQALPERVRAQHGIDIALAGLTSPQDGVAAIPEPVSSHGNAVRSGFLASAVKALRTPFGNREDNGYRPGVSNQWAVSENILRDILIEAQFGSLDPEARQAWAKCDRPAYTRDILRAPRWIDRQRPSYEPQSTFFKDMLEPGAALTPVGMIMLCVNFGVADAQDGQCATDVLIHAINDGRLDGARLAHSMRILLKVGLVKPNNWVSQLVKPNRWTNRLAIAADESPLHAQVVRNALMLALPAIPAEGMRNVHTLLELLFNLFVEAEEAVTDPDCRAFLEGIGGTGKAAKLAKKLLALAEGDPLPHRRAAAVAALRGRLARAGHSVKGVA